MPTYSAVYQEQAQLLLLRVVEAGRILGVGDATMRALMAKYPDELPAIRLRPGGIRVAYVDLDRFAERRRKAAHAEVTA